MKKMYFIKFFFLQIGWHDFAFFDPTMYETLRKLIVDAELPNAHEIFSTLDLTFSVELSPEEGGKRVDLIDGGQDCAVTATNVRSYARKYALQRMEVCAKKPLKVYGFFLKCYLLPFGEYTPLSSKGKRSPPVHTFLLPCGRLQAYPK